MPTSDLDALLSAIDESNMDSSRYFMEAAKKVKADVFKTEDGREIPMIVNATYGHARTKSLSELFKEEEDAKMIMPKPRAPGGSSVSGRLKSGLSALLGAKGTPPSSSSAIYATQETAKDEYWLRSKILDALSDEQYGADPELVAALIGSIDEFTTALTEEVAEMAEKELHTAEEEAAIAVADHLTAQWATEAEQVSLNAPGSLTVLKEDNNYSKRPHIGGEDFRPVRAYVGKKGHMICCFAPMAAETYSEMQMPHTECLDKLNGYRAQLEANGTMEKLNTIRKTKEEIEHKRNLEMQSKNYADAGSW